jgi:hypothetical protein
MGLLKKSAAPFDRHSKTVPTESSEDITGGNTISIGGVAVSRSIPVVSRGVDEGTRSIVSYLLMTGMFLQTLWVMIFSSRDIPGKAVTISVRTRSMVLCVS